MCKNILVIVFLFSVNIYAASTVYEKNCVRCHKKLEVGIDKFFYRYLLVYSSEKDTKEAIKQYILNPTKQKSLLADGLIRRFGLKKPTKLDEKQLDTAIDLYWKKYNLIGKLR